MITYTTLIIPVKYWEPYLPTPRCRKYRYRETKTNAKARIRTIDREDAKLAFTLSDYGHERQHQTEILCFKSKLYIRCWRHLTEEEKRAGQEGYAIEYEEEHHLCSPWNHNLGLEEIKDWYKKESANFLYVRTDNGKTEVWERCGEPRYLVMTFGLGHNHGGTSMFVETCYNNNISNDNYFPATKSEEAIAYANSIAEARGDTKDIGKFESMISVHMPGMVKLNPKRQHGKGNPFINQLNEITRNAGSAFEAGLLVLATASK